MGWREHAHVVDGDATGKRSRAIGISAEAATHGQVQHEGTVDITRTYAKQMMRSKFVVLK